MPLTVLFFPVESSPSGEHELWRLPALQSWERWYFKVNISVQAPSLLESTVQS